MSANLSVLEVTYEDVADSCRSPGADGDISAHSCMKEIADFLQITLNFDNPTTIKKVINKPYKEILSNFKQVVSALKNSAFAEFAGTLE